MFKVFFTAIIFALLSAVPTFSAEIKIASWNIKNLDIKSDKRTTSEYKKLANYIKKLDADIVALQEVNGEASARAIFPIGYNFYFSTREHEQRTGIAVRENIKVVSFKNVKQLNIDNSLREHGQRQGNDIVIEVSGKQLRLLNVHLKSRCWQAPFNQNYNSEDEKYGCDILQAQTKIIKDWIENRAKEKTPFILLGDFNRRFDIDEHYEQDESMWKKLNQGSNLIGINKNKTSQCWNKNRYPQYVDHIIADERANKFIVPNSFSQLQFTKEDREKISDHCPISVQLRFEN